jgi:hypothetical protein
MSPPSSRDADANTDAEGEVVGALLAALDVYNPDDVDLPRT